ncbi:GTP 3',8-cyclase MoaA [Oleidesulfovibrio sp.]|uniref:GTP 3',8-cyclase MoaA n=1 Tax=Oleidesulfovibrio sp. TaxID=2909707 RepID=UPI003A83CB48
MSTIHKALYDNVPQDQQSPAVERFSDEYGRQVSYLRLSVTDRCNLRCMYCWTCDGLSFIPHTKILTYEEMLRLVDAAVSLGVEKVRLTGGEPFVRKGFLYLVESLAKRHPSLDVRITTNATLLAGKVAALRDLGVRYVNVSLDTFDRERFQKVTGRDMLRQVRRALDEVLEHQIGLKLNAVALRGFNDDELPVFLNFARRNPVDVRFIEFMPMGGCTRWREENFWSAKDILSQAGDYANLIPVQGRTRRSGPAKLYDIEGGKGRFGLITPLSDHFCKSCNRLRITPDGRLRTCLFSDKEYRLRPVIRHPKLGMEAARKIMQLAALRKPLGYRMLEHLHADGSVAEKRMSAIGG